MLITRSFSLFVWLLLLMGSPLLAVAQTVNLILDDGTMDEEFQGTGSFTVTRDGSTAQALNVFVTMSGTASYTSDFTWVNLNGYSHPTWYVNIPAGQSSTTVTLTPSKDNLNEGVESLVFTLRESAEDPGNYVIGGQTTAELSIADEPTTSPP